MLHPVFPEVNCSDCVLRKQCIHVDHLRFFFRHGVGLQPIYYTPFRYIRWVGVLCVRELRMLWSSLFVKGHFTSSECVEVIINSASTS